MRSSSGLSLTVVLTEDEYFSIPCKYGTTLQKEGLMMVRWISIAETPGPVSVAHSLRVFVRGPAVKADGTLALFEREYYMNYRDLPPQVRDRFMREAIGVRAHAHWLLEKLL